MIINNITTETRNLETLDIDVISTLDMVKMINNQDQKVANAVALQAKEIAKVIDHGYKIILNGGRIIYFGAGTSGRLGILDASEIFPTFGEKNLFIALIAGGPKAIQSSLESVEDSRELIITDLKTINATNKDMFVGIAASGRTPYVIAGLEHGKKLGATTVSISTSQHALISKIAEIAIEAVTGPETITGSTRMKSGTAQKMILNQISTGIMIKYGKTYSNMMIDMKATNKKLIQRGINMLITLLNVSKEKAEKLFKDSEQNVKLAMIMFHKNISKELAIKLLKHNDGKLRKIMET